MTSKELTLDEVLNEVDDDLENDEFLSELNRNQTSTKSPLTNELSKEKPKFGSDKESLISTSFIVKKSEEISSVTPDLFHQWRKSNPQKIPENNENSKTISPSTSDAIESSNSSFPSSLSTSPTESPTESISSSLENKSELIPQQNLSSGNLEQILSDTSDENMVDDGELQEYTVQLNQTEEKKLTKAPSSAQLSQLLSSKQQAHICTFQYLIRMSEQISKEKNRTQTGFPVCVAVSGKMFAMGTTRGFVTIFDINEIIRTVIGSIDYGPVTALDISNTQGNIYWVVIGYQSGHVVLWEFKEHDPTATKRIVKTLQSHSNCVTSVRFLSDKIRFVTTDIKGVMYLCSMSKMLMVTVAETQLILNGNAGPVYSVVPMMDVTSQYNFSLVAFATGVKVHVMSVHQASVKEHHRVMKPKNISKNILPIISWCKLLDGKKTVPMLAIGWGNNIHLSELKEHKKGLKFHPKMKFVLDTDIMAMEWLDNRALLLLTAKDEIKIFDPFSQKQVDSINVKFMELVYHNKFSRQNQTGGQTIYSYSGSFCQHQKGVYILGIKAIHFAYLLSWEERINAFISEGKWQDALRLSRDFYENRVTIAIGLPTDRGSRRNIVADKISMILQMYLKSAIIANTSSNKKDSVDELAYENVASACIEYLVLIDRTEILFTTVYEQFQEIGMQIFFLEMLEPYILSDQLRFLHPEIMHLFVEHYSKQNKLQQVENCITHLAIGSLDFHQVATLCKEHHLFRALIYIYNVGISDYYTPLDVIVQALIGYINKTSTRLELNNTLSLTFQYLSKCFQDRPFVEKIPPKKSIRMEIVNYLFAKENGTNREQFFRVTCLLMLDTSSFLGALSLCLDDSSFLLSNKQEIINAIVFIVENYSARFTEKQMEGIHVFIAYHFAKNSIEVVPTLLDKVINWLSISQNKENFKERENTMLLIAKRMTLNPSLSTAKSNYDFSKLLVLAEGASFYKVAEFMYGQNKMYGKALICRMKDSDLKETVYDYARIQLESSELSQKEKSDVRSAIISNLKQLVTINSAQASRLIIQYFSSEHDKLLRALDPYPELQFAFLSSIMNKEQSTQSGMNELLEQTGVRITSEMHEIYVKLMCQFTPDAVLTYLMTQENYPLESCLKLCKNAGLTDATVYLLERTGDVGGALSLLLISLENILVELQKYYDNHVPTISETSRMFDFMYFLISQAGSGDAEKKTQKALNNCILLCQRNSRKLGDTENESVWFRLLDAIAVPMRTTRIESKQATSLGTGRLHSVLTLFMRHVLEAMNGYIPLPSILNKIVKDHGRDEFGDFRSVILGMLDSYTYEQTILKIANRIIVNDSFSAQKQLIKTRSKAIRTTSKRCVICTRPFHDKREDSLVFFCGHCFHQKCLTEQNRVSPSCPLCSSKQPQRKS